MNRLFGQKRIRGLTRDGRSVWLTNDDRWSANPRDAEILEDEAHSDIRLLDAEMASSGLAEVTLEECFESERMAS